LNPNFPIVKDLQSDPRSTFASGRTPRLAKRRPCGELGKASCPLPGAGLFGEWKLLIQIKVQFEDIDPRLSQEPPLTILGVFGY